MAQKRSRVRNPHLEMRLFRARAWVAFAVCLALVLVLASRMVWLQLVSYESYQGQAQDNRVRVRPVPPTRGMIYDRNGEILAENLPSYQLEVTPELIKRGQLDATLDAVNEVIPLTENDRKRFNKALRRQRRGSYKGVPLKFRLSDEEVANFAVSRHRFPGVDIAARLNRNYPHKSEAVHTLGYVGRVDEKDLKRLDERNYQGTTHTGKAGIERYYEKLLHGTVGSEQVEVNVQGRVLRVLEQEPPEPGKNIYLTIDSRLQAVAEKAFGEEAGALVALDPHNGEVLAMTSMPTYDPNLFVNGISFKDYAELRDGFYRPLFNRALTGQYPPGSTVKQFMGLAGLELGLVSGGTKVHCPGFYQLPNEEHRYRCWKKEGHAHVHLNASITQSCDVYFYDLAHRLGVDRMHDYLAQFGFGEKTGIDTLGEKSGLLPSSKWKKTRRGQPWFPGETLIAGIGQGYFLATPIQLAASTATLAMDGKQVTPHLLKAVEDLEQGLVDTPLSEKPSVPIRKAGNWRYVKKSMRNVVHSARGTAQRIGWGSPYKIAGKTGTAQVFSVAQDEEYDEELVKKSLRDHALFVAWAPADDPQIVVAVVVENGGHGGSVAAPIAKQVMDAYLLPALEDAK